MRAGTWIAITMVLGAGVCACSKAPEKKQPAAESSASDDAEKATAKKAKAAKKAEEPAKAAFEKNREGFSTCESDRLAGVSALAKAVKSGSGREEANAKIVASRACLEKWWDSIEKELDKKDIPRDVWMPIFTAWKDAPTVFPLPKGKPLAKGQKLELAGSLTKTTMTLSVPAEWKRDPGEKEPKERADYRADDFHCYVMNNRTPDVDDPAQDAASKRWSTWTTHVQQLDVDGIKGVLWVTKNGDGVGMSWTAYRDLEDDGHGEQATVTLDWSKLDKLGDAQVQLFMDILASVKFVK